MSEPVKSSAGLGLDLCWWLEVDLRLLFRRIVCEAAWLKIGLSLMRGGLCVGLRLLLRLRVKSVVVFWRRLGLLLLCLLGGWSVV